MWLESSYCSEAPYISTTLAFSTANRGELSGSVKIKKHILIQKIEDMLYHLICVADNSLYKALFLALFFIPSINRGLHIGIRASGFCKSLGVTDKEVSSGVSHVVETLYQGILGGLVKVNHNIPTKD